MRIPRHQWSKTYLMAAFHPGSLTRVYLVIALVNIGFACIQFRRTWDTVQNIEPSTCTCTFCRWNRECLTLLTAYMGPDYPLFLPVALTFDTEMTMHESVQFTLEGPQSTRDYLALQFYAPGYGWVRLGDRYRWFANSMIHNFHCLRQIQVGISHPNQTEVSRGHIGHCLDYMRQYILCNADAHLEPGDFTTRNHLTSRVTDTRVCQNWVAVYEWMAANEENWKNHANSV